MVGRTLVPWNYQSGLFNLDRITEEAHIFIVTTRSVGSWKCMVLECKSVGSGFGSCFLIYGVKVSVSEVESASKSFAWDFYLDLLNQNVFLKSVQAVPMGIWS